jgi:hypothetical protein
MLPLALVRQYAVGQHIDVAVADQEIVLHYALALLNAQGLIGRQPGAEMPGPLLFKGGTALRKCVFGSTGRFSQDIDLDATNRNGFEAEIEAAFAAHNPFHGIRFAVPSFRYSQDENFSGTVNYEHQDATGAFDLQISYRLEPVLEPRTLTLVPQGYFARVECGVLDLFGIDPYEMIGEKLMACNRRFGGSAKDVYDLYLWPSGPSTLSSYDVSPSSRRGPIAAASPASIPRRFSRASNLPASAGRTSSSSSHAGSRPSDR